MIGLFRRRAAAVLRSVTFSESHSEVCTAACRADARLDHVRTAATAQLLGWR